eukprot:scaffold581_cov263-Pinguiococcus_pyrenoidosus.AAC.14
MHALLEKSPGSVRFRSGPRTFALGCPCTAAARLFGHATDQAASRSSEKVKHLVGLLHLVSWPPFPRLVRSDGRGSLGGDCCGGRGLAQQRQRRCPRVCHADCPQCPGDGL